MAAPLSYGRFHHKIIKIGRKEVNDLERYLMYLRKSRMDTDYENVSVAETLSRHRTILEDFCRAKKLHVVEVLEEVVSGESLYARPEMMRLLELINTECTPVLYAWILRDFPEALPGVWADYAGATGK